MAEEQKKPKKRMTATQAASSIGPLVKEFIAGAVRVKAEGKQKLAYTFIVCHHEEILRALDVLPVWTSVATARRDGLPFGDSQCAGNNGVGIVVPAIFIWQAVGNAVPNRVGRICKLWPHFLLVW